MNAYMLSNSVLCIILVEIFVRFFLFFLFVLEFVFQSRQQDSPVGREAG